MSRYLHFTTNMEIAQAYEENPSLQFEMRWPTAAVMKPSDPIPYKPVKLEGLHWEDGGLRVRFFWMTKAGGAIHDAKPTVIRAWVP